MGQRKFRGDDTDKWLYGFGNAADADLTISGNTTDAPIDSACAGSAGSNSLSATNAAFAPGQLVLIHQTRGTNVGEYELNKIAGYVAGTITLQHLLQNTYVSSGASCAQVIVIKQNNNITINGGVTLTTKAWNGTVGGITVLMAKGSVTVNGNINANGTTGGSSSSSPVAGASNVGGFWGGNGYIGSTPRQGDSGEGTANARSAQYTPNGNGGGGGYISGGATDAGGGGGNGGAGVTGGGYAAPSAPGQGGNVAGNAGLTLMVFGGGGGGATKDSSGTTGAGGSGGGIVLIIAKSIVISGSIVTNGGNGGNAGSSNSGGGAGAGGSVLLKCQTATLGTNLIVASGGSGGTGGSYAGGNGGVGRIHLDYKDSYTGITNPTINATQDISLDYPKMGGLFLQEFI